MNRHLMDREGDSVSEYAVSWDAEKHIKLDLPFVDFKAELQLGVLLVVYWFTVCLYVVSFTRK